MKKSSSKEQSHTNTELKRYLGAMHEEHMEALKGISEKFIDSDRKFDGLYKRFDSVEQKLDSHTEMIGKLTVDLEVVKSDVEIIKSDISIIKTDLKQKVDRTEFATLERRVVRLESKVR